MPKSDEFFPSEQELSSLLQAVAVPEITSASRELGITSSFFGHAYVQGQESSLIGSQHSAWAVRAILRSAHAPNRVLVQVQARPSTAHPSGYCGFVLKGAYDRGHPESFSAKSKVVQYNTAGFSGWV